MDYREMVREIFKDELEQKAAEIAAETKKETLIEAVRNMVTDLNLTAQQAMDVLKVSPELRKELLPLL